jgi:predicted ribosome quality control (RQC) complex YloA/Tae2 family protein
MSTYFGAPVGIKAYEAGKKQVRSQINDALDRARRKLASLERQSSSDEDIELLRKKGELIFSYSSTVTPGQAQLRAQYDLDGPMLVIKLDPTLSPSKNAQNYFGQYEKAKRAAEEIPKLRAKARYEAAYLEQLATDIDMAESWPEIDAIREILQEAGYWQGPKTRTPRSGRPGIRRFIADDGFVILVGRNAVQNHVLVTERSTGDDLWLHARGIPGSHVIVKNDGRPIPDSVMQRAAELAAYYSAARGDTSVEVSVTQRRYVRPVKGGMPGLVTFKNEQTMAVRPDKG